MHRTTKIKLHVRTFALLLLFNFTNGQNNPLHFKSEIDFGNGIVFSTFLDVAINENAFTITSPKNADARFLGSSSKARMGRLMGKLPKKGIIITIRGTQNSDSLFGETKIPMVGKLKFKGIANRNGLSGEFRNSEGIFVGTLTGVNSTEDKIDYTHLYPQIVKTVQNNIYSTRALNSEEWLRFEKKLQQLFAVVHDDVELYFGFNMLTQKLPFTHLSLQISNITEAPEDTTATQKTVIFEEKDSATAYLQIKNFSTSTAELAAILPKIVANSGYKNLIIDLRNNGGGGINAAFELAKYIVTSDLEVGYFVTNKLRYDDFNPELFKSLPEIQPQSTATFTEDLKSLPGVKLIFKKPENAVFTGKLYVLTNGGTGSTCEPMVYSLKNNNRATIIGERTYGGMLAAVPFYLSDKYLLMVPIADFFTYDGIRLDKVGVTPDIEVKSDDALAKALEIIHEKTPTSTPKS